MNIFEKLKSGEPVDMMSEEYRSAVQELHRADKALFHLNHAEPQSEEWSWAFSSIMPGVHGIADPVIKVDGDKAQITYTSILNANAYGARGTYRMKGTHHYERRDGAWIAVNR